MSLGIDPAVVIALFAGFIGGMSVPTYYGIERMAGFGRWVADRLPYLPPPGKDEAEAMEDAIKTDEESE